MPGGRNTDDPTLKLDPSAPSREIQMRNSALPEWQDDKIVLKACLVCCFQTSYSLKGYYFERLAVVHFGSRGDIW